MLFKVFFFLFIFWPHKYSFISSFTNLQLQFSKELSVLGIGFEFNLAPVSPHFRSNSYTLYFSLIQTVQLMGIAHTKTLNLDSL